MNWGEAGARPSKTGLRHLRLKRQLVLLFVWGFLVGSPAFELQAKPAGPVIDFDLQTATLVVKQGPLALPVSLMCPEFVVGNKILGTGVRPSSVKGAIPQGIVEATYPPVVCGDGARLEVKLFLDWSADEFVLRKWARYRLVGGTQSPMLEEIKLEKLDISDRPVWMGLPSNQNQPVFMKGFFCGIEFPFAATRVEQKTLILGHRPGLILRPGHWHESRRAVYGVSLAGGERLAFRGYIAKHQVNRHGVHIDYNSWYSLSSVDYEANLLELVKIFKEKLYQPYGVNFDTFTIDLGWSNPKSIWEIDLNSFPQGFTNLQRAIAEMKAHLGVWNSPSGCYPQALDTAWARSQGYETFVSAGFSQNRLMCLAGERYRGQYEARLLEMAQRYAVRMFKLDGCIDDCKASDHGHEPAPLASEAIAEGMIKTFSAVRKAAPDLWLECTAYGGSGSPWWLFYLDSVIGCFGDDIVFGRAPSPIYRESYTSSRDFYCLQGMHYSTVPISGQEALGVFHQTDEDFMNDGVTAVMRGHRFLPFYVNPAFMHNTRWKNLAGLITWARKNASVLEETVPLQPADWIKSGVPPMTHQAVMPREPYGFAHWNDRQGLVELRNPWIKPAIYALKLGQETSAPAGLTGLSAVSLYPEVRCYGRNLKVGDTLNVPLAPYETLVLSLARNQVVKGIPDVAGVIGRQIKVVSRRSDQQRIEPQIPQTLKAQSADGSKSISTGLAEIIPEEDLPTSVTQGTTSWTSRLGKNAFVTKIKLDADVLTTTSQPQLLVLLEGGKNLPKYAYRLKVNDRDLTMDARPSFTSSLPYNRGILSQCPEPQWVFLQVRLPQDAHSFWEYKKNMNRVSLDLLAGDNCSKVSAWIWATKPGGITPNYHNALPSPETISVDGAALMEPMDLKIAQVVESARLP